MAVVLMAVTETGYFSGGKSAETFRMLSLDVGHELRAKYTRHVTPSGALERVHQYLVLGIAKGTHHLDLLINESCRRVNNLDNVRDLIEAIIRSQLSASRWVAIAI